MLKTHLHTQFKLPDEKDRRKKLTPEKREAITDLLRQGLPIKAIARAVELNKNTVYRVSNPEKYEILKAQFRERRADGRYKTTKEERRHIMAEHRAYKAQAIADSLGTTVESRFTSTKGHKKPSTP